LSRIPFAGLVAVVILFGAGLGWWLGRPTPLQPTLHAHFTPFDPNAPPPAPTGADSAPGFEQRNVLRAALASALDKVEASPCDPAARKAFFDAFADQANALTNDSINSPDENGPAYWRTDADLALSKRIGELQQRDYINTDELARLAIIKRMGPAAQAFLQNNSDRTPIKLDKCGLTPAAAIGA
jgi:hypothetical protein